MVTSVGFSAHCAVCLVRKAEHHLLSSSFLARFEDMKKEVIRLTLVARQRDIMIAAMLYAIGDAKAIKGKAPIQTAEKHMNEQPTCHAKAIARRQSLPGIALL